MPKFVFNKHAIHDTLARSIAKDINNPDSPVATTFNSVISEKLAGTELSQSDQQKLLEAFASVFDLSIHYAVDTVMAVLEGLN